MLPDLGICKFAIFAILSVTGFVNNIYFPDVLKCTKMVFTGTFSYLMASMTISIISLLLVMAPSQRKSALLATYISFIALATIANTIGEP